MEENLTKLELAKKWYVEQQQEKAFKIFLEAIEETIVKKDYLPSTEGLELYKKALAIYQEEKGSDGQEKIITLYAPIVEKNPEFCELAYLVAAAYANIGNYLSFFDLFYKTYDRHPNHYLAYKTKGILGIKLFERTLPGSSKEKLRNKMIEEFSKAIELFPTDSSLYRLKILYSSNNNQSKIIKECLNKIIRDDIVIPRAELDFYMHCALKLEDKEFIKKFIDKASTWYAYSRAIEDARSQLKLLK